MNSRALQLILGVIIFLSSTPSGMAKSLIPGKARADFFVPTEQVSAQLEAAFCTEELSQGEAGSQTKEQAAFAPTGELATADAENDFSAESNPGGERQSKRVQKRVQQRNLVGSARIQFSNRLAHISNAQGKRRSPLATDALAQRTSMIRFAHLAAGID